VITMSTTAPEYLTSLRNGFADAVQQWLDQSTTAWDQWQQAWSPVVEAVGLGGPGALGAYPGRRAGGLRHREHGHEHGHDCDCGHRHDYGHHVGKGCGCEGSDGCHEHGHDHSGLGRRSHEHDHGQHGWHDHRGCGCHDHCGCGDVCDCCVPEADVIVRARAGEVRVVPFLLHNPWRREREVSLEVGPWHGCDGADLEVRAVLEEEKVVLAPCEDRVVRLLVSTRVTRDDGSSAGRGADAVGQDASKDVAADSPAKPAKAASVAAAAREPLDVVVGTRGRTKDVESCVSAYADVRFEGCARPQRVAVVVLPAECDAVDVGCDCGCCC
jgi:hypothetical protein